MDFGIGPLECCLGLAPFALVAVVGFVVVKVVESGRKASGRRL